LILLKFRPGPWCTLHCLTAGPRVIRGPDGKFSAGAGDFLAIGPPALIGLLLRCLGGEHGGTALLRQFRLILFEARDDATATRLYS
jgi:hypothetical protein